MSSNVTKLVVIAAMFVALPILLAQEPTPAPASTDPAIRARLDRLDSVPVFYNITTDRIQQIFEQGRERGNRANVFTVIGDSNSTAGDFLRPIGMEGDFCELGPYDHLQETIDFFSVPPRPDSRNSFYRLSLTARNGLSTSSALDPLWATDPACRANETLVDCEYRLVRPSVAIIMIGLMDLESVSIDTYQANLDRIVEMSIDAGVIPVLTTFTVLPDYPTAEQSLWEKSLDLNIAMLEVAEKYQTPVINLWKALQSLPDYGIGPDRTHLKHEVGSFCSFDGPEQRIGSTLRNLLTLQALDQLRQFVLEP